MTLGEAPVGTLAPSIHGGAWCKTAYGWQWNGHRKTGKGSTFPRPGADWNGQLLTPASSESKEQ